MKFLRYLTLIFSITTLCSCASTYQLDAAESLPLDQKVIPTSKCDVKCKVVLESSFPEKKGKMKRSIMKVTLLSVNGKFGDTTFFDYQGSFNSSWDSSFKITLPEKQLTLLTKPNYWKEQGGVEDEITFSTEAGKSYFVGQILYNLASDKDYSYDWTPVIVDLQSYELLYPKNSEALKGDSVHQPTIYIPL